MAKKHSPPPVTPTTTSSAELLQAHQAQFVLHNWSDEDCVRILKRSKEAVCFYSRTKRKGDELMIIDAVAGSNSH
jgi:hypothetical protein